MDRGSEWCGVALGRFGSTLPSPLPGGGWVVVLLTDGCASRVFCSIMAQRWRWDGVR